MRPVAGQPIRMGEGMGRRMELRKEEVAMKSRLRMNLFGLPAVLSLLIALVAVLVVGSTLPPPRLGPGAEEAQRGGCR